MRIFLLAFIALFSVQCGFQAAQDSLIKEAEERLPSYLQEKIGDIEHEVNDIVRNLDLSDQGPLSLDYYKKLRRPTSTHTTYLTEYLNVGPVKDIQDQIARYEAAIKEARALVRKYENDILSAPKKGDLAFYQKPITTSYEWYEQEIAKQKKIVANAERAIPALKEKIIVELRKIGLDIKPQELELLLSSPEGQSIIEMALVFKNIKRVTAEYKKRVVNNKDDTTRGLIYAKMYYGLVYLMDDIQQKYVEKVTQQINAIPRHAADIQALKADPTAYLKRYGASDVDLQKLDQMKLTDGNPSVNLEELTQRYVTNGGEKDLIQRYMGAIAQINLNLATLSLYRKYLVSRRAKVAEVNKKTRERLIAARNHHKLVEITIDLVSEIESAFRDYDVVSELRVPEMDDLTSDAFIGSFKQIAVRLAE